MSDPIKPQLTDLPVPVVDLGPLPVGLWPGPAVTVDGAEQLGQPAARPLLITAGTQAHAGSGSVSLLLTMVTRGGAYRGRCE